MNNGRIWFVVLIMLLGNSCQTWPVPKTELCISGDGYTFICNDSRRDPPDYEREYPVDYICTNPSDYSELYSYCTTIREELIKCRSF